MIGGDSTTQTRAPERSAEDTRFDYYRHTIGSVAQVVVVVDADGALIDVCPGMTAQFGYDPEALIGQSALELIHPSDHQLVADELVEEMRNPLRQTPSILVRIRHANGSYIESELLGVARFDDPLIGGLVVSLREVTGHRVRERAMAAGSYLFSATPTIASDATTMFDNTGKRMYCSPSLERMLGYSAKALMDIKPNRLIHSDDRDAWRAVSREATSVDNGTARREVRLLRSDGSAVWVEATIVNLLNNRDVLGVVVHFRNIDERRRMDEELQRRAAQDSLTGLDNRLTFNERLAGARSVDPGAPITVLFCDLDNFKAVNDKFGHATGDDFLRRVAWSIRAAAYSGDTVARIGGDEFCVLSRQPRTELEAHGLAEKIRDAVTSTELDPETTDRSVSVGVSIGVIWTDLAGEDGDLLKHADQAMYAAKRRGSSLIEVFSRS